MPRLPSFQHPPGVAIPQPCLARVRTREGVTFECAVANLTELGAFLRTSADFVLRQRLTIELFDRTLDAVVLFVSHDPPGVVVAYECDLHTQARLLGEQDSVEVLPDQGFDLDQPWAEDTAAGVTLGAGEEPDPVFEPVEELPKLGSDDLVPIVEEEPADLDPLLFAAAMKDDALGRVDSLSELPMLDPVDTNELASTAPELDPVPGLPEDSPFAPASSFGAGRPAAASSDRLVPMAPSDQVIVPPPPPPEPALTLASAEAAASTDAEVPVDVSIPVDDLAEDLTPIGSQLTDPEPSTKGPAVEDEVSRTLPTLDSDGFTVRFESAEAYRLQFDSNLRHGGLVVRAAPLSIGTQRMLALSVPGHEPYTVSARVVFHEPGKLGFMLDSLALHKGRLANLGG